MSLLFYSSEGFHQEQHSFKKDSQLNSEGSSKFDNVLQSSIEETAMIGLDAMQRANSTLEDFVSHFSSSLEKNVPSCD